MLRFSASGFSGFLHRIGIARFVLALIVATFAVGAAHANGIPTGSHVQTVARPAATVVKARSGTAVQPSTSGYDWQSMGHDNSHGAYLNDANMNASIAPKLGVNWMTNLLAADVGGPSVAFNPTFGRTVIYSGNEHGDLSAIDQSNGQALWSTSLGVGDSIYSTPMISTDQASVWVGTAYKPTFYKLDTATGAIKCAKRQLLAIQASATEGKASNGTQQVYVSPIDGPGHAGPLLAFRESDCTQVFSANPYIVPFTGSWASPSYGSDANGRKLVLQGTADPDSTEYAIDATTGALDWYFVTDQTGDHDIAAAATVSPPGKNGFADGVVYVIGKDQICYALDLTTGKQYWAFDFGKDGGTPNGTARSSAALARNTLVFGMTNGVYAVNATTGAKLWRYLTPTNNEVLSSPAVVGPPGREVVAFADVTGVFHVVSLASGTELYHYQTGNFITASPAYYNGHFFITSADGFVYDFAVGGGNGAPPKTGITTPTQGSNVPYASSITITGTATDTRGVNAVQVGVQMGGSSGNWYNAAMGTWSSGALTNVIPVANPGATSSSWTIAVPVPTSGTTIQVYANAVNTAHLADVTGAQVGFAVSGSTSTPQLKTSAIFIAPAATFTATGSGFGASEPIAFSVAGATIGNTTSDGSGNINATLTLPANSLFGVTPLTATGSKSKRSALTPIDIANAWLQAGYAPDHGAFEPNDLTLQHIISPGGNIFLSRAWYYLAGAAVESSPAVYDGTVFFGNDAGTLAAVGTDTAAPIWTLTIPSGAAIRSTPAIDPATGNLSFTADDGNVYIVTAADGTGSSSVSVGGLLTSPTVYNATIYVGSDNATLTSINEQTGAKNWAATLSGAVHSTPALDTASGTVTVGDDSGAISAFNSATGALLWRVVTGGPVTAMPTIANGIVYSGSSDGKLYAIKEATGAKVWTYAANTPLTTGSPYDPNFKLLYAGGANGILYAVNASNGTLAWSTSAPNGKSPYVGLSAVNAFAFGNESSGSLIAYHTTQAGRFNSNHKTAAALTTAPAINDGTVYVGASDGGLYAYTSYGALPQIVPAAIRRADAARALSGPRRAWPARRTVMSRFLWAGQRDYPLHVDAFSRKGSATAAAPLKYHGGPVQTAPRSYAVFWKPANAAFESRYIPSVTALLAAAHGSTGGGFAGGFVDTAPYPTTMSDAALQTELARAIVANHWPTGVNSQFFILTANGAIPPSAGFCSYHSTFALMHDRSKLVVYGVLPYTGAVGACGTPAGLTLTGDAAFDAVRSNLARLQRELANDPLLNGWSGTDGGEVGPAF